MILITCVDDKMGMLFNKRRQSMDSILRERVLKMCAGKKLWMNEYSRKDKSGRRRLLLCGKHQP